MDKKLISLTLLCIAISACSNVSQKKLLSNIVGTWACQNSDISHNDIARSGMTFHRNLDLKIYQASTAGSNIVLDNTDHYATGNYTVRKNILIAKLKYKAPLVSLSLDEKLKKSIPVPKNELTHTYIVSRISSHSLVMEQKGSDMNRGKLRCQKVTEPAIGYHYTQFLSALDKKLKVARAQLAKLEELRQNAITRKSIAENINLVRDAAYYRKALGTLLHIASETIPLKLRVTSIVGQDLNFQFSGITDNDNVVEKFVAKLRGRSEIDSVQISENRPFNIVSKHNQKKITQKLYEFRISIAFTSSTFKYAVPGSLPIKLGYAEQHKEQNQKLREDFTNESSALVRSRNIPGLLRKLRRSAIASNVKFLEFQPHDEQIIKQRLIQLSTTVRIKGQYKELAVFLKKLSGYKKLVALSGIQIEPKSYDSVSKQLIMSGYLTFYGTHANGRKLTINPYKKLFPIASTKKSRRKRKRKIIKIANLRDPFNSYEVKSKHIVRYKPGCRHLASTLPLKRLLYVGRIKQDAGYTALLKTPANTILRVKEGHCIARSISVSKILRSKILLRQDFKLRNGRWTPRTITLHATDK